MSKINMDNNIKKLSGLLLNNTNSVNNDKFQNIELDKIVAQPQPRKNFDEETLKELTDSIILYGVMTPITVSKNPDEEGTYILRHGERRYRASSKAGLKTIPAIIDDGYENNLIEKQLIENLQRDNLTAQEIADSILYLIDVKKIKKIDVASALSKSNAFVSQYYAMATFDHNLKDIILTKTQDVMIIAEFKRLLKNPTEKEERIITDFVTQYKKTLNRSDIEELKNMLKNINADNSHIAGNKNDTSDVEVTDNQNDFDYTNNQNKENANNKHTIDNANLGIAGKQENYNQNNTENNDVTIIKHDISDDVAGNQDDSNYTNTNDKADADNEHVIDNDNLGITGNQDSNHYDNIVDGKAPNMIQLIETKKILNIYAIIRKLAPEASEEIIENIKQILKGYETNVESYK